MSHGNVAVVIPSEDVHPVISQMEKSISGRFSLAVARLFVKPPQGIPKERQQEILGELDALPRGSVASYTRGDWEVTIIYQDPNQRVQAGIVTALSDGAQFDEHTHGVGEWVLCFNGRMEITDQDGVHELSPDSPMYHIEGGNSHYGRALVAGTSVLFINRPEERS